jgi:hypothetical protein
MVVEAIAALKEVTGADVDDPTRAELIPTTTVILRRYNDDLVTVEKTGGSLLKKWLLGDLDGQEVEDVYRFETNDDNDCEYYVESITELATFKGFEVTASTHAYEPPRARPHSYKHANANGAAFSFVPGAGKIWKKKALGRLKKALNEDRNALRKSRNASRLFNEARRERAAIATVADAAMGDVMLMGLAAGPMRLPPKHLGGGVMHE